MNLEAPIDDVGKVVKRQKTCASKTDAALNKIIEMVQAAQRQLEEGGPDCADPEALLKRLQQSIEDAGLLKEMNSSTKEFHTAIAKLGKVCDSGLGLSMWAADGRGVIVFPLRPMPRERPWCGTSVLLLPKTPTVGTQPTPQSWGAVPHPFSRWLRSLVHSTCCEGSYNKCLHGHAQTTVPLCHTHRFCAHPSSGWRTTTLPHNS